MEVASEPSRPRTDIEIVEAVLKQLQAIPPKDQKLRTAAKKALTGDVEFLSILKRCLIADQPPLDVLVGVGPDIIFNALCSGDVPIENIHAIVDRLQEAATEEAQQLRLSLIAYSIGVGCQPDTDLFASTPETSLPTYASSHAPGLFSAILKWLDDADLSEYKKRKLASILIRSLPNLASSAKHLLWAMRSIIRSLRNSLVDPALFSAKAIREWNDRAHRLPAALLVELAQVVAERSDGYQTQFWDEKKLGDLSALVPERQTPPRHSSETSKAEELEPLYIQPDAEDQTRQREEPLTKPHEHSQPNSGATRFAAGSLESPDSPIPSVLKRLSRFHAELGAILQIAGENELLKQQLFEIQQKLTAAERSREQAVQQMKAHETEAAEAVTALVRLRQVYAEDSAALKKERSRSESLEKKLVDLENRNSYAESRIEALKAEADEASRARILYGEHRATEMKNSLKEKISAEVAGLPALGPELSQDSFSMLRVRFRNLLKLLHDSSILDGLPGEPGR